MLSALGPHRGADGVTVCSRGARRILRAMQAAGVRRIVAISGAPVPSRDPVDGALQRVPLTDRPLGRRHRTAVGRNAGGWRVSRADAYHV